ncbi:hypothetical protein [Longimicrobium sp.]|uniref:hypothetical protein n=1 Tax=Longimicrobium sp. TaxID=2029185 RepID=UPI002C2EE76E|nr:hypothetical protein [Longimicrobium sp.]HSU17507.1 hypothetical protein [Longimicrobium sp.]
MSDHGSDDERLAAFLDGRMDVRSRKEMLAHLTGSDEDRAVLAGTAAILRQLEEAGAGAPGQASAAASGLESVDRVVAEGVIPLDTRRTSRPEPDHKVRPTRAPVLRWMAAAAAVVGIALITGRALRTRASVAGEPVRLVTRLAHGAEGLPAGWTERRPWTSVRGDDRGGATSPGERLARSARAGAMLVDLAVAVQARDAAATRVLAIQLAGRFDPQGGRSGALRRIADGAAGSPERLRPLIGEATERIAKRLDRDALRLGAWTEAAGLAAAWQDAGFFRGGETRRMLDQAGRLTAADPPAHAAVQQVRLLLAADPLRWEALAPAIDALARELASE